MKVGGGVWSSNHRLRRAKPSSAAAAKNLRKTEVSFPEEKIKNLGKTQLKI